MLVMWVILQLKSLMGPGPVQILIGCLRPQHVNVQTMLSIITMQWRYVYIDGHIIDDKMMKTERDRNEVNSMVYNTET